MFASNDIDKPAQPKTNPRVVGAFILVVGVAMAYWQIWMPLQAAKEHAENISFSMKGQFLGTAGPLLGLAMLILGDKLNLARHGNSRKMTWQSVVVMLLLVGLGIGVNIWVKDELAKYGYSTR